ncbi:MAG TPA: saccharopine dehydrogenase C-terminal domain-containing protein [Gammaproteobacteria bacterium]|jgi:saccharopine dehydrogenase-like NADP-dependent oxidoreductase|nr:saccharopine dehydrogenase C-terminal domain-containing protein [Gammaproteobacteria bacterium]
MHHVLIVGAGKIGSLIAFLLARSNHYSVYLADLDEKNPYTRQLAGLKNIQYVIMDARDTHTISSFISKHAQIKAIVSSLPFYCNTPIAVLAAEHQLHYFDLTEDITTTQTVEKIAHATNSTFVPQCGLAPGFISIIANQLMKNFPTLDTVKMRVGALPINISNALQYSLTWSTDGLINEYGNLCRAIENNQEVLLLPLEGLEEIKIDGLTYEAFNTSGGIGSLVQTYLGRVKQLSYKTIRYPGHCAKMKFLMNDLRLNEEREVLKHIFEQAIPKTYQDVVLVYVSVMGLQDGQLIEENYVKKFYPKKIEGFRWSAIQLTTASEVCAVIDLVFQNPEKYSGLVRQEQFTLEDIVSNQFGQYYA